MRKKKDNILVYAFVANRRSLSEGARKVTGYSHLGAMVHGLVTGASFALAPNGSGS